jgi:hypothetical protein
VAKEKYNDETKGITCWMIMPRSHGVIAKRNTTVADDAGAVDGHNAVDNTNIDSNIDIVARIESSSPQMSAPKMMTIIGRSDDRS